MPKPKNKIRPVEVQLPPVVLAPEDMPLKGQWEKPKNKKELLTSPGGILVPVEEMHEDPELERLVGKVMRSRTFRRKIERQIERRETQVSRLETWADQVRDHLGDVQVLSKATGPIKVVLPCEGGHTVEWTSANRIPAEAIASKLRRQGWELGRHIRCPEHAHPRKAKKVKGGEVEMAVDALDQAAATDAARTAKRLAMMAIDESFNVQKGQYKAGVTDKTIAAELGCSEEVVQRLREEFFGPLKVPDDVEDVQRQIEECRRDFAHKQSQLATDFEQKIGKLASRLESLIRKNKWKDPC